MNSKVRKYARVIIEDYAKGEWHPDMVGEVKLWLTNGKNSREKEEALLEYWEKLGYTESRETYAALVEVRKKLGMSRYIPGSHYQHQEGMDPAESWFRDMGDPRVNPGAIYYEGGSRYESPTVDTISLARNVAGTGDRRLRKFGARAAAIFIPLLLAMATALWYTRPDVTEDRGGTLITYATGNGETKRLFFPDGTEVILNESSRIEYLKDRHTGLSGEAYFKVASDPSNPFVVSTDEMNVVVTGTEFNVRAYPSEQTTGIDLYSGTVEIAIGKRNFVMKPGTRISYDHTSEDVWTGNSSEPDKPEWVSEKLTLYHKTLSEIFSMLEWYYNITIDIPDNIDDGSLYGFELGGDEDIDKALGLLRSVSGSFSYVRSGERIIINSTK